METASRARKEDRWKQREKAMKQDKKEEREGRGRYRYKGLEKGQIPQNSLKINPL